MRNIYFYKTIIGEIGIVMDDVFLINLFFNHHLDLLNDHDSIISETKEIRNIFNQIQEYFHGERKFFDVQLALKGTNFQKKVWNELLKIPHGETRSYRDIAQAIGVPKGARAVGMANHKNPISIIVPCHRVIGASGELVGYGGGLMLKQKLLVLERNKGSSPL
jgi:methylated-DNA-[protein]-cysteine S-methyltransferase